MFKAELSELLFPSRCVSCGVLGITICSRCRAHWNPHIYRQQLSGLPIYSAMKYSPAAQKIILGAKESGYRECDLLIIDALSHIWRQAMRELGPATLIPIPSKKSALRKRGRDFVVAITSLLEAPYLNALTIKKPVRDQSALTQQQRSANMEGAFVLAALPTSDVIIIADIVRSGATLLEARRACARRGVRVKGAITAVMA